MLIIEELRNGQRMVVMKKDWHPNRISKSYTPPRPRYHLSKDAWDLQTSLLDYKHKGNKS
jgi:hypothetical protein